LQICPRCNKTELKNPIETNAISTLDKSIWICSDCGLNQHRMNFLLHKFKKKEITKERLLELIPKEEITFERNFAKMLGLKPIV